MKNKTKCWMCKGKGRENVSKDVMGGQCYNCKGTGYAEPILNNWRKCDISTLENPLDKLDELSKSIPTSSGKQNKEITNKKKVIEKYKKKGFDFTDLARTIQDFLKPPEENHGKVTVADKIKEYLEIKDIGQVIIDGCDLILRLRMQQYSIASGILMNYITAKYKNKNIFKNQQIEDALQNLACVTKLESLNIEEPLYKGIELGEHVKCYQTNRMCKDVKDCWITRKGFAKCIDKNK